MPFLYVLIVKILSYVEEIKNIYLSIYLSFYRGGSMISGKGVHMYKGVGFALLILSNFILYPMKMKTK